MKIKNRIKNNIPIEISGNFFIEILNAKEIMLTGRFEITELESSVLKIKCREHIISFSGEKIKISCYSTDGLRITGIIKNIEFF